MSNKRFLWIGALLAGLLILCVVGLATRSNPWWIRSLPPTPPQAMQIQTGFFRDYMSVADGTRRETTFEIDQLEAEVRQFYRNELTRQGWSYRGAAAQECTSHLQPSRRVSDVYDRRGRTLTVDIIPPATTERRQVIVVEYQGTLSYPISRTPGPGTGLHETLIGDWQAIDATTGRAFILCVHEQGAVSLAVPGIDIITGKYQWIDAGIQVTLDTSMPPGTTDPAGDDDHGRCSELPALLIGGCRSKQVDPAAYPEPDSLTRPRPPVGPPPSMAPYPAPMLPIKEYLHIEAMFAVSAEQNTLTLTEPSGVVQTFSRVMQ